MPPVDLRLPVSLLIVYYIGTAVALMLCSLSLAAIFRTKRTPYSTRLLSMGLLAFDSIFLVFACVTKLFSFSDMTLLWHITRGFQIAAQIVVSSMALERLFVLNWPYVYLRVATNELINKVCSSIFVFGYAHYIFMRVVACYIRNKTLKCGPAYATYYFVLVFLLPVISLISYCKIYRIIRNKRQNLRTGNDLKQYKGTLVSFFVMINCTVTQVLCLMLSILNLLRKAKSVQDDGNLATLADCVNVINCIVDPLIYVVWFRETRMQVLKIVGVVCPYIRPMTQKMWFEIFDIQTTTLNCKR